MENKFANVPIEADTKVLFQQNAKFGDYDILYQKWSWDGITAESIIYVENEVKHLTDEQLESEVRSSPLMNDKDSSITITRDTEGYTFINFNFETE